jgi:hypothetical protein
MVHENVFPAPSELSDCKVQGGMGSVVVLLLAERVRKAAHNGRHSLADCLTHSAAKNTRESSGSNESVWQVMASKASEPRVGGKEFQCVQRGSAR